MRKVPKRVIWLLLSVVCLICFGGGLAASEAKRVIETEVFSEKGSFYQEDIQIELTIPGMSEIYYTQDGTTPSREACLYQEPIRLMAERDGVKSYTIQAVGYDEENNASEVYVHTYFLGKRIEERFSTWVIAITSDPANLYDDEKGILVGGRMKREYLESHPEEAESAAPANYYLRGKESERDAYVEILDEKGELLTSGPVGLRVHGGVSRSLDQKSLRLIAREHKGKESFGIRLFQEKEQESYRKFVLRNSGNDNQCAFMRNECALRLFKEAGFLDTTEFRPAAVFINGEYYGFEWVTEVYDDCYFHEKYGTTGNQGSWQVLDVENELLEPEDPGDLALVRAVQDWNEIYTLCTTEDLTDDSVFQRFAEKVDVENFLLYHFMEIYFANPDWPFNNNKVYRWYSNGNNYGEESRDGKWRFLTYDFDEGLAKTDSSAASDLSLSKALGLEDSGHWKRYYPMLAAVLKREDMKERFLQIAEKQMGGALSPENFCQVIDEIAAMREEEVLIYQWECENDQTISFEEYRNQLLKEEQVLRDFAWERPGFMREELKVLDDF